MSESDGWDQARFFLELLGYQYAGQAHCRACASDSAEFADPCLWAGLHPLPVFAWSEGSENEVCADCGRSLL